MSSVSIQLVSPASGELLLNSYANRRSHQVSIQLVSPTSGEGKARNKGKKAECKGIFRVSIQLVSPTSGEVITNNSKPIISYNTLSCFHSISFPNEWGVRGAKRLHCIEKVSIQLVSPTSGELTCPDFVTQDRPRGNRQQSFHSISFPNEWGDSIRANAMRCF